MADVVSDKDVIWQAELDGKYDCRVTRIDPVRGQLTVRCGEVEILSEVVSLAYGAIFGPDIDDLQDWQYKCLAVVDRMNPDAAAS